MMDIAPFLKSLMSSAGLPGYESPAANLISNIWHPLADEFHTTRLGSLHALRRGNLRAPGHSLLLTAHMDAIGMLVAGFEDGFLKLMPVGAIDPRILPGQEITVHGIRPLHGVIVARPTMLMQDDGQKDVPGFDHLLVDLGIPVRRVTELVQVGDPVSFANEPIQLGNGILSGHSLDNRASIAALTLVLESLQKKDHAWDVWCAATVQEETAYAGAATSAFMLKPDLAITLDVTYARGPGAHSWEYFPLGGGPTLGVGPHVHPYLLQVLRMLAGKMEMPHSIEPMPETSMTETEFIQLTAAGIPTAIVSLPIRYMHTPVEVAALSDIQRAAELLTEFACALEADFMDRVVWDD